MTVKVTSVYFPSLLLNLRLPPLPSAKNFELERPMPIPEFATKLSS